ncbi:CCA tRNA nucleotidyltransferase [Deinococcus alpinitundrae]|uniref:CCA tRNA nucleotidyltransferase n=1 Tax=Deinococcus alpinitundrae TaxID=468913 RepID=UPI001ED8DF68|nr:CCA tRNA nucleotidyltransferase [Deinococcus alpinitundrae]
MPDTLAHLLPESPPPSLTPGTLAQAERRLADWKLDALAVLDGAEVVGAVTVSGGVGPVPLLTSTAKLEEARAALRSAPALAVTHAGAFAALLTPADLAPPAAPELAERVWAALGEADRELLMRLRAQLPSGRLALVGGAVRDALLGLTPLDLDLVVVGADVEALARVSGWPFVFHPAYRNATLRLPGERAADLVSARMERYPAPGASPLPHPGTLAQDLRRRDFSLNALALVVGETPELHDPCGGLADLLGRELRPLSARSLTDDASRLVRGARLAARLNLRAAPELLAQVPQALAAASRTPRLDAELRLLLAEPRPGKVARELVDWGAGALLPPAALAVLDLLDALPERPPEAVYAAGLLSSAADRPVWEQRLHLGPRPVALLLRALGDDHAAPGSPEAVLRGVLRPQAYDPLTGKDVLQFGVASGPGVGAALAHLAALRRAGQVTSREGEATALQAYLAGSVS